MIRFGIIVAFAALAAVQAAAQSTINLGGSCTGGQSISTTAEQDALTPIARNLDNAGICLSRGLAKNCTQAQLNAVSGCAAGACGTIYPSTVAGARDYALNGMKACYLDQVGSKVQAQNLADLAAQGQINGSVIDTNTNCSNAGLANGCTRFQVACRYLTGSAGGADCKP